MPVFTLLNHIKGSQYHILLEGKLKNWYNYNICFHDNRMYLKFAINLVSLNFYWAVQLPSFVHQLIMFKDMNELSQNMD